MISSKKPSGVTIIVLDRKTNKGRSFTVYGNVDEVYKAVRRVFKA